MERAIERAKGHLDTTRDKVEAQASRVSSEQWLMYAGAAGTAIGAASLILNPKETEKMFARDTIGGIATTATINDHGPHKFRHLNALHLAGASAMQAMVAHEKPTARMLAMNGTIWTAGSALTYAHTYHIKSIKAETGAALATAQLVVGAAMLGRAIQMDRNSINDKIF